VYFYIAANAQIDRPRGLKEKVIVGLSNQISRKAVDSRECWGWVAYEPETPKEIVMELINNN